MARKNNVAFFAIEGMLSPSTCTSDALGAITEAIVGVVNGSARVSLERAALSFAFDPRRAAFTSIRKVLGRELAVLRVSLLPIRMVDGQRGGMRSVRTRTDVAGKRR